MAKGTKGIAVAGTLIADTFYKIDTYPDAGNLTNIRDIVSYIGGTGNMLLDLAKMDPSVPLKVSGLIGDDTQGRMMKGELLKYPNIDISNLTVEGLSSVTHVMNAQDTKQRTFFYQGGASDIYDESYIDWETLDADIFHLEYLLLMAKVDGPDEEYGTLGARILHDARERGMKTSIDVVSEQSDRAAGIVSAALKYTDYCSINEVEAEAATGVKLTGADGLTEEKVKEALLKLKEKGVTTWAVIHCPQCGYGYDCQKQEFVKVPSLKLPEGFIKGTNGAGDAYLSGILYGAYQDMALEEAMILGTACAACSLSEVNGTDGLRPLSEVKKLYQELR